MQEIFHNKARLKTPLIIIITKIHNTSSNTAILTKINIKGTNQVIHILNKIINGHNNSKDKELPLEMLIAIMKSFNKNT